MNEEEIKVFQNELQAKINTKKFCWICGRIDMITEHHVIGQKIRGAKVNVVIPLCENCQEIVHKSDEFMAMIRRMFLR